MSEAVQTLLTILVLLPVGAGVGVLFFHGIRSAMKSAIKQSPPVAQDSAVEIERIKAQDHADARALYERVIRDKLDVIKTALAMGADEHEIKELDARLEQLIGSEKLHALLEVQDKGVPPLQDELLDVDLSQEIENLKRSKETEAPQ